MGHTPTSTPVSIRGSPLMTARPPQVFLVIAPSPHEPDGSARVFDLDTRLAFPCPFDEYAARTLRWGDAARPALKFKRLFRVVPAADYLRGFSSDRRHMRDAETGEWLAPPPPYPPIQAGGAGSNLDAYRGMHLEEATRGDDEGLGQLLSEPQFVRRFGSRALLESAGLSPP